MPPITVKPEPVDIEMSDIPRIKAEPVVKPIPQEVRPQEPNYTPYTNVRDIEYTPEAALQQGLGMVEAIKAVISKLQVGSKLRSDVWSREIKKYAGLILLGLSCLFFAGWKMPARNLRSSPFVEVIPSLFIHSSC